MSARWRWPSWVVILAVLAQPGAAAARGASPPPAPGMENADVLRLVALGVRAEVVIAVIRAAERRRFDLSFPALAALERAGVPPPVLQAMQQADVVRGQGDPPLRAETALTIDHSPLQCVVAEQFTRVEACFTPAADVLQARVVFRAQEDSSWYRVEMRPQGSCFTAVLPKARRKAGRLRYFLRALDTTMAEAHTAEQSPAVVSDPERCRRLGLRPALTETSASPVVAAESFGAPRVPPGFLPDGVVFADPAVRP
jgi:hypothetical protein